MSIVTVSSGTIGAGATTRAVSHWSRPSAKEAMRALLADASNPYRLTPAVVDHLVSHAQVTDWRGGRRLFGPGDAKDFVHFVVAGSVRLEVCGERDRGTIAAFVPPGRFVGPVLPMAPSRIRFAALTHSTALIALVSHASMRRALEALPLEHALGFVANHADALHARLADRCVLPWMSVSNRVLHELRTLSRDFGRPVAGGTLIDLRLTREDLARCINASRSNVSRALARLRRAGLLDVVDRHVVVRAAA